MKKIALLCMICLFSFRIYANDLNKAQKVYKENLPYVRCGIPCGVGGGIISGAGYLGNSVVTGNFTWTGLGTAVGVGALTGATFGIGGPIGAVWGFNAALGGAMATAVADKYGK